MLRKKPIYLDKQSYHMTILYNIMYMLIVFGEGEGASLFWFLWPVNQAKSSCFGEAGGLPFEDSWDTRNRWGSCKWQTVRFTSLFSIKKYGSEEKVSGATQWKGL